MIEVASRELRETEARKSQSIEQLRELIKLNPQIKMCRTDSVFLLRFLRVKKFSVMAAFEMLEKNLAERQTRSDWYLNLSLDDQKISALFDTGYLCALPQKDELGRQLMFYRFSVLDTNKFTSTDVIRLNNLIFSYCLLSEDIQVAGFVLIFDATNVSMQFMSLFSLTDLHNWLVGVQRACPVRLKEVHIVNLPSVFSTLLKVVQSAMGKKIRKRLIIHDNMESLMKKFNYREMLPSEYGGKYSTAKIVSECRKNVESCRQIILDDDKHKIVMMNKDWLCSDNDESGMPGSFRKLEVD